ncbi:MAG: hypothetical protein ACE15B_17455 [Bryobacteraceae bacterium]
MTRVLSALTLILLAVAGPLGADTFTLTSNNSSIAVDPHSQRGVYSWTIDGEEVMFQQWFWIRVGGDTREIPVVAPLHSMSPGVTDAATAVYSSPTYDIQMNFTLVGGQPNSKVSALNEHISILNKSSAYLPVSFFQYSNIRFSQGNDTTQFLSDNTVQQTGQGDLSFFLDETIVNTLSLTHHEAGVFPQTLDRLNDDQPTTLNDNDFARGNATWAFQWDKVLRPRSGVLVIDKNLNISDPPAPVPVPEPGAFVLLASCAAIYTAWRRRRLPR